MIFLQSISQVKHSNRISGLSTLTPIDKAFEPISWVNIIKALNGQLTVDWQPPYNRPSAYGQINESVYPQTGWVNFPDHRKFNMWYYPEEGAIYWDAPKGGTANIWWGVVGTGLCCCFFLDILLVT